LELREDPMSQNIEVATDLESAHRKYRMGMEIMREGARAETGQTPKEIIWTRNKARLYHYQPTGARPLPVPVLMVYALINRPYVLDLTPGNSLVEYLVDRGFDIYLLDWGTPGDEDKNISFENYILDYIPHALRRMLRHSKAAEYSLLGYCMGGTMAAMYAALFPTWPLRNLVLLTAPIDFTPAAAGPFGVWTSEKYFNPDRVVDAFGNVPGELIDIANRMARPVSNYIGTYVAMWDRLLQDKPMDTWLAMNKWVNDGVPFPGAAFHQWIRDFYQQNKLAKGELRLRGQRVDLSQIRCPLISIAGKKDHICPPPQAEAIMKLASSEDKEFHVLNAGHVGLLTGSNARKDLWSRLDSWLEARSK
jgi:polyhydroxyalkanoate synthase